MVSRQRRRRRLARLREHALPRARALLRATRSGPGSRTGRPRSRRTSTPPSGCSASSPSTADDPADQLLREFGREIGADQTYAKTRVGVYFGTPGETVARPVLRRRGPRAHRLHRLRPLHGRLPAQRQEHAAEELPLARRARRGDDHARAHGRRHPAARRARRLGRLRGHDGAHRRVAAPRPPRPHRARRRRRRRPARHEPAARARAGCRGSLPRVSDRLGELVRTNSEAILAVTLPKGAEDMTKRVAISSSVYPDPDTHIETVTYGAAGDSMSALFTLLVGDGTKLTRPLKLLGAMRAPPGAAARGSPGRAAGRAARSSCSSCSRSTTRSRCARRRRRFGARPAADRAGPGAAEPDVHPRRQRVRRVARRAHRRHRAERADRGGGEHPDDRAHPGRRGDRRRSRRTA